MFISNETILKTGISKRLFWKNYFWNKNESYFEFNFEMRISNLLASLMVVYILFVGNLKLLRSWVGNFNKNLLCIKSYNHPSTLAWDMYKVAELKNWILSNIKLSKISMI